MVIGVSPGSKSCVSTRIEWRISTNPGFEKNSGSQGPFVRDHLVTRHTHRQLVNRILMDWMPNDKVLTLNSNSAA